MQNLRAILILLLCLAVPTAGWASVMNGAHCNRMAPHKAENMHSAGHGATEHVSMAAHGVGHDHDASGGQANPGSSNNYNMCECACACNSDVCSSSCAGAMAFLRHEPYLSDPGKQVAVPIAERQLATPHGISPLRPPISLS